MKNNKKALIDEIVSRMIQINIIDFNAVGETSKDKKFVDHRVSCHQTINAIIKNCSGLCLRDYDDITILRDEVIATVYEIARKIEKDFTEQELMNVYMDLDEKKLPETNVFLASIYKLGVPMTKGRLSGSRRSSKGMIKAFTNTEYNEEILSNSSIGIATDENTDANVCFFIRWFNENRESFLTSRQLRFIENENSVNEKNRSSYRKRIYQNTLRAFEKEFTSDSDRVNQIEKDISTIERILDAKDFVSEYKKYIDKAVVIDAIVSHTDMKIMQRFNRGDYSKDVIKAYRVSLFKKLAELNKLLESAKNEGRM
jgi:hypothetical protein